MVTFVLPKLLKRSLKTVALANACTGRSCVQTTKKRHARRIVERFNTKRVVEMRDDLTDLLDKAFFVLNKAVNVQTTLKFHGI
jgi:hypothetical protein